jgi:hypothetical protein
MLELAAFLKPLMTVLWTRIAAITYLAMLKAAAMINISGRYEQ